MRSTEKKVNIGSIGMGLHWSRRGIEDQYPIRESDGSGKRNNAEYCRMNNKKWGFNPLLRRGRYLQVVFIS
jgi:hypothetical protein